MSAAEIQIKARLKAREEGIPYDQALEDVIKALPASERVLEIVRDESPIEGGDKPFQVAAQLPLFKAGLLGTAVQVWSSYEGGYGPTPVCLAVEGNQQPITIRVDDDAIEDQIQFAGGYIIGWTEALGGDIEKLSIWLKPVGEPEKEPETYFTEEKEDVNAG